MEPLPMDHTSLDDLERYPKDQPLYDIERPHHNDVLCGRGVSTNRHPGNESFRSLVGLNKELYVTSTKRQKMSISRSIVEAVRTLEPPGRFLEKNVVGLETFLWSDIGDRKAVEKTSQALRDGAASLRKQLSQDLGDPDFLSAVFDMDSLATKIDETTSTDKKKKKKPKTKKQVKKGPAHRRTKSNPDGLSAAKKKSLSRKIKASDVAKQPPCPMSPPRSQPPSPGSRRYIREVPNRAHSMSAIPSDHSPPLVPPPMFRYREDRPMPILSTGSFESARPHYEYDRQGPPPSMHWQYNPHRFGHDSPAPPLSPTPTPSHVSSNHYDYSRHPPMSPGGMHPMTPRTPDYTQRPPMSPVMNHRSWSPHSFAYGQPPQFPLGSPHSLPGADYPGWRSPMSLTSPSQNGYGPRELSVPVLNEPPMSPMAMSPVQSAMMRLPSSAIEFRPPPSPVRKGPMAKKNRCSPSSISTAPSSKEKDGLLCLTAQQACCESPTVVVYGVLDESRSDNVLKPEVEVILSQATDERFEREMALDSYMQGNTSTNTGQDGSDAVQVSMDSDSFSPLPFDQDDDNDVITESLMQMTADLLQMPEIAPCSPHDEICR